MRTRILLGFVGVLAIATLASVLVARSFLLSRVDERIDDELVQEAAELRRLAGGIDPATGEPFGTNVERIFRVYLERNVPARREALLTFVDGRPFLRSRQVVPYRLDRDPALVERWGSIDDSDRGSVETPAGRVEYLAVPLRNEGRTLGVFVVAEFRDLQARDYNPAIAATGAVGVVLLLVGSLLAWRLAEGILRPVRVVTRAAQEISETDLSRRIEVQGDDEIAHLARTFNDMLARLDSAFETRRRFLDDAGHELRTPITIVRGHLELLEDDPEERAATIALVTDELDRMARMVNELLLLAKAQQPDFLHLETVDCGALVDELLTKAQALAPREWRLDHRGRGLVVADRQRLTQALVQLAENACAHTGDGDEIALGSSIERGEARFWVRDEGPGIPPELQREIFERFTRGGRRGRTDGAGLGLSIVRAIADAHGGRVELRSRPGAGSTFTIVLPVEGPPRAREEP
ncbi:MAG TPA: HAMP domain-containing sensor histidine kinase [Gaiellaceae bacterium]|nr:HAMP domain-containing sensor histidine kinase [Gaiellaceae bacterium]